MPTPYAGPILPNAPQADYDGSGKCFLTDDNPPFGPPDYVGELDAYLLSPVITIGGEDAVVRYASWYSNGHTYWPQGPPLGADVFEVDVRECDGIPGPWIPVDAVGPFETESLGGWFENYFWIKPPLFPEVPQNIQIRFKASGWDSTGAVEAAIDWFEVTLLGS